MLDKYIKTCITTFCSPCCVHEQPFVLQPHPAWIHFRHLKRKQMIQNDSCRYHEIVIQMMKHEHGQLCWKYEAKWCNTVLLLGYKHLLFASLYAFSCVASVSMKATSHFEHSTYLLAISKVNEVIHLDPVLKKKNLSGVWLQPTVSTLPTQSYRHM